MARGVVLSSCLLAPLLLFAVLFAAVPAMAAPEQAPFVVTDAAGRSVVIPAPVRRIVTLGGALRFVTYLQGLELVAGIENLEKKPLDPGRLYGYVTAGPAKDIAVVGEGGPGGKLPDFEKIIGVHPDLIIAVGLERSQVETIEEKTAIPVLMLHSGAMAPLDLHQVKESLRLLGRVIDRGERAESLIHFISRLEDDLAARTASVSTRPAVYVGAISYRGKHGITSSDSTYPPLAWVNGGNVAAAVTPPGHVFIDQEKLLLWNPDVIFLDAGGLDRVEEEYRKNPAFFTMLKAVREGRVYAVPPYNVYHTNIEIALANACFMGKILSPQGFTGLDPVQEADVIFEAFLGAKLYEQLRQNRYGYGRVVFGEAGIAIR